MFPREPKKLAKLQSLFLVEAAKYKCSTDYPGSSTLH